MLPSLLAALVLSAPVPKPQPIDLSWKFTKGDVFYVTYDLIVTTERDYGGGYDFDMIYHMTVVAKVTVTSTGPKETALVLTFVNGKYGSADLTHLIKQHPVDDLEGKKVAVTFDSECRITEVAGAEQWVDGSEPTANGALLEPRVRAVVNALLWAVPGKTVAEGDGWTTNRQDTHPDKTNTIEQSERGMVRETEDGLTRLSADVDVKAWVTRGEGVESELSGTGGTRSVMFDTKVGRVRSMKEKVTTEGKVTPLPDPTKFFLPRAHNLRWALTTRITVTDEKPKAKK